jgi:hypothetical protein
VLNLCESCDLGLSGLLQRAGARLLGREQAAEPISKRLKRFTVKSFMDAWTLNVERLQQCCVHVGSIDQEQAPVRVPFCARQLFGALRERTAAGHVPLSAIRRVGEARPGGATP